MTSRREYIVPAEEPAEDVPAEGKVPAEQMIKTRHYVTLIDGIDQLDRWIYEDQHGSPYVEINGEFFPLSELKRWYKVQIHL